METCRDKRQNHGLFRYCFLVATCTLTFVIGAMFWTDKSVVTRFNSNLCDTQLKSSVMMKAKVKTVPTMMKKKVLIWPMTTDPGTIGELRQILRDGIDNSQYLQQTFDVDDNDAEIWAVDLLRTQCNELASIVGESLGRRKQQRQILVGEEQSHDQPSPTWRMVLFDFNDAGTAGHLDCMETLATILGRRNIEYGCRQFYKGRNISLIGTDEGSPFETYGTPQNFTMEEQYGPPSQSVHVLRYPVRTDMKTEFDYMWVTFQETHNTTKWDLISKPREIDVATFTNPDSVLVQSIRLRGFVSQIIRNMSSTIYTVATSTKHEELRVFAQETGSTDEAGRSTPSAGYVQTMFETKIVVTAQRDYHEDHYRFMEAIVSGAMVMTDPMHPLPMGYEHGKNVVVYTSLQELRDLIMYYIQNPSERLRIARAGYDLAMDHHRSWHVVERVLMLQSTPDDASL
jgi:hypothetical protein